MDLVGGAVALQSRLPYPHHFVYYIVNIKLFMKFSYLVFHASLRLLFLDVEINPGPQRPVPVVCRLHCSNVRVLAGNLSGLAVASWYDILLFSEPFSQICVRFRSCCFRIWLPCHFVMGRIPRARGKAACV